MKLTPALGSLRLWLTLDADALLVIGGTQRELEPRLIALCRTLRRLRTQGESRPLIAPVFADTASPLHSRLDDPERIASLLTTMAGSLDIVQWMNTTDSWADLVSRPRTAEPTTPKQLRDQLRADPRAGGLSADLLLDRLLESILQASLEDGERLLDAAMLESVLDESRRDLHRWAEWRAPWRRELRIRLLPEESRAALCGQAAPSEVALATPWQRPGRPRLPSQYLRNSRTPFTGQRAAISTILRWCSSEVLYSTRMVCGPPGSGKTRTLFETCQTLISQGWTAGFLPEEASDMQVSRLSAASGDRLVVVDDAELRQDVLRKLQDSPHGPGRLRVVALSALSGWWPGERIDLQPIPQPDRLAHLKLAASAYAEATGRPAPRMVPVPDANLIRWPIGVQLTALLAIHRLPLDDLPGRVLTLEQRGWRDLGLDPDDLRTNIAAQIIGADTAEGLERIDTDPRPLFDQLLVEQLRADPALLHRSLDIQTALLALCRIASSHPEAQGWLATLIAADPDARLPVALRVARMLATDPAATPLGPILAATGIGGVSALDAPLRGLTVSYTRQVLLGLRDTQHSSPERPAALAMGNGARVSHRAGSNRQRRQPPPDLVDAVWDQLRERLSVLLPHHIEALEALKTTQHPLEAGRMAALIRLPQKQRICLEFAISQLGMTLLDLPSPTSLPRPPEAARLAAREAAGRLSIACGHRVGPPSSLSAIQEALAHLHSHLDPTLPALAAALHEVGSLAGYAALIAPLEALSEGRRCDWPHPDALRADLAIQSHLQGRPHSLPPLRAEHSPSLRLLLHTAQLATGTDPVSVLHQVRVDLAGMPDQDLPVRVALLDSIARWHLDHSAPDAALPRLHEAVHGLAQLSDRRGVLFDPFLALSLHNLGARLYPLDRDAGLDATLSAAEAWRRQVRRSGEAFLPDLAATLGNIGAMLTHSQRPDEALALIRKGISVCWGGVPSGALSAMPGIRNLLTNSAVSETTPDGLLLRARQRTAHTPSRPYRLWQLSELTAELEQSPDDAALIGLSSRIWERHRTPPEQLRPRLGEALHNLGGALGSAGNLAAAIESTAGAAAVLGRVPGAAIECAVALDNLSALRGMVGDTEGALSASEEAVALLNDADAPAERASALSNLAAALYALGCHQRAAQIAEEASEADGATPSTRMMALFNLGLARAATGEPDSAAEALRAALVAADQPPHRIADCYRRLTVR